MMMDIIVAMVSEKCPILQTSRTIYLGASQLDARIQKEKVRQQTIPVSLHAVVTSPFPEGGEGNNSFRGGGVFSR